MSLIEQHVISERAFARRSSRVGQVAARAVLMAELVVDLAGYGVDHMIIESRGELEDGEVGDRESVKALFGYPEALAGIARMQLTLGQSPGFSRLQRANIVSEARYLT